ncbi:MAG: DUF6033 family protein [Lachnospira sp.]
MAGLIYSNYSNYGLNTMNSAKDDNIHNNNGDNSGKVDNTSKAEGMDKISKTNYGKTFGNPKLSEKAAKYYDELKKKYGNMDFVLVSKDMKETAKNNAGSFANASKTVVLIDEEKIEKMASDENYRKQYEGIIANAASGLGQLKSQMESAGVKVSGYGIQVNDDGTTTYFAALKKSSSEQKARIEKKREEKRAAKKEEEKAEAKKAKEKAFEDRIKSHATGRNNEDYEDDYITISANSVEELIQKISDYEFDVKADSVQTDAERQVGQRIDYQG